MEITQSQHCINDNNDNDDNVICVNMCFDFLVDFVNVETHDL